MENVMERRARLHTDENICVQLRVSKKICLKYSPAYGTINMR